MTDVQKLKNCFKDMGLKWTIQQAEESVDNLVKLALTLDKINIRNSERKQAEMTNC